MRCPYCNKYLRQVHATAYCYWCACDKADGMFGTLAMWEKVASLVKIRNAGKKYQLKPDVKEKRAEYMAQRYATDPAHKERVLERGRKWRKENKDKVAEYNKKYRETHKEYYRNYYQKLKQGGKDA